jgi:hypothetical protein
MLYRMKKDTVRPQDRLDAEIIFQKIRPGRGGLMSVRKFRSVEEMPGRSRRPPLDPENLRLAFGLTTLANGLHPLRIPAAVRKFRSWDEALESRASRERAQRRAAPRT